MTMTLTVNCDSPAFASDPGELSRIVKDVSDRFEKGPYPINVKVLDIDGELVGTLDVHE